MPEIPGIVVYKKGHIGVYVGNGDVIECTLGSRGDGVVLTKLTAAEWTDWFFAPDVQYEDDRPVKKIYVKPKINDIFKKLITRRDKLK